jgi:uncharacterized protein
MLIRPSRIEIDQTLLLEEVLPATILQLDEPMARQSAPVQASLSVSRDGESLLITGQVSTTLQVCCGRCAEWLDWPVTIPQFILLLEPPFADTIDLTPYLREDILLDLPVAASCRLDTDGRCPHSGILYPTASEPPPMSGLDAWKELDKLKGREEG